MNDDKKRLIIDITFGVIAIGCLIGNMIVIANKTKTEIISEENSNKEDKQYSNKEDKQYSNKEDKQYSNKNSLFNKIFKKSKK